jgi:hypothetical protein
VELSSIFVENDRWVRDSLAAMGRGGELTLPLGLNATTDAHVRLLTGTSYTLYANPAIEARAAFEAAIVAMSLLAGLTS